MIVPLWVLAFIVPAEILALASAVLDWILSLPSGSVATNLIR